MIIKKTNPGFSINWADKEIFVDNLAKGDINILSKVNLEVNKDKVFASPGEYEVENILIRGYPNGDNIALVLGNREVKIIYLNGDIQEKTLKEINEEWNEIDIGIFKNCKNFENLKNKLKLKIIIFLEQVKMPKGKRESVKEIKLNLKKLEEKIYLLN